MKSRVADTHGKVLMKLILLMAIIAASLWFAGTHTLIRTDRELFWITKDEIGFKDVYVDIRVWGAIDYLKKPWITKALIARGYQQAKGKLTGQQEGFPIGEKVVETYHGIKESAGDTYEKTKDAIHGAYEDGKDTVNETLGDVQEQTEKMTRDLKEKTGK